MKAGPSVRLISVPPALRAELDAQHNSVESMVERLAQKSNSHCLNHNCASVCTVNLERVLGLSASVLLSVKWGK